MPKPRALTPEQEVEAFTVWKATPRRGTVAALARSYGLTWVGMRDCWNASSVNSKSRIHVNP